MMCPRTIFFFSFFFFFFFFFFFKSRIVCREEEKKRIKLRRSRSFRGGVVEALIRREYSILRFSYKYTTKRKNWLDEQQEKDR